MKTIMYINIYLILDRKLSKKIFLKIKYQMKENIIIIKITIIIGTQGSMIIIIEIIIIQEEIIIMMPLEEKGVIQGKIFTIQKAKEVVKVINIIQTIVNIIGIIKCIGQIAEPRKISHVKKIHTLHLIQNISNQILNHQVLLLTQINLPYYIPIN